MNKHNITEIDVTRSLPPTLKQDPDMVAAAQVIGGQLQENVRLSRLNLIYHRIDELDEEKLDILAYDLHVDWYETNMPIQVKRETIKTSVRVHKYLGTRYAMETVIKNWFPDGEVLEWYEYGGRPFYFRVRLNDAIDPLQKNKILHALGYAKRLTAWLDAIVIVLDAQYKNRNCFVPIRLRMNSRVSNYFHTPVIFNGECDFDGAIFFDQQISNRFHLVNLRIATGIREKNRISIGYRELGTIHTNNQIAGSKLKIYASARYPPFYFDGQRDFDGSHLFHGNLSLEDGRRHTFFLNSMSIATGTTNQYHNSAHLIRDTMHTFSGENDFDGTRRFNASITKEEL